jgi:starch phosphorylase
MKFVLNGGLIVGTLDGANIEIAEAVGMDQMYIFGARASQVEDIRHAQKYRKHQMDPKLEAVLDALRADQFGEYEIFAPLVDTLTVGGDYYLISNDFSGYLEAMDRAEQEYRQPKLWARKSILATAGMGMFSSDRTIKEYAERIWRIKPCPPPSFP